MHFCKTDREEKVRIANAAYRKAAKAMCGVCRQRGIGILSKGNGQPGKPEQYDMWYHPTDCKNGIPAAVCNSGAILSLIR
jgi:hypothetical protein